MARRYCRLAILGGLGWFIWLASTAEGRVRGVCDGVRPGWTIDELNAYAERKDSGPMVKGAGTHFLVEHISHSDYDCTVQIEDGRVVSAEFRSRLPKLDWTRTCAR